jgi:hypothetical protein
MAIQKSMRGIVTAALIAFAQSPLGISAQTRSKMPGDYAGSFLPILDRMGMNGGRGKKRYHATIWRAVHEDRNKYIPAGPYANVSHARDIYRRQVGGFYNLRSRMQDVAKAGASAAEMAGRLAEAEKFMLETLRNAAKTLGTESRTC